MRRNVSLYILLLAVSALAQTARYPGAVATDQDLLKAVDNAFSQLAAPVPDAAALTVSVNSGASFAGKTHFSVTVEGEQMLICSVSGNTLNVCTSGRGFAGTTAAAHPAGVAVRGNITAWHHNALAEEVKAIEGALGPNLENVVSSSSFTSLNVQAAPGQVDNVLSVRNENGANLLTQTPAGVFAITVPGGGYYSTVASFGNGTNNTSISPTGITTPYGTFGTNIMVPNIYGSQGVNPGTLTLFGGSAAGSKIVLNENSRVLVGTTTDDGVNRLQVNGSVAATGFIGALTGNATTVTNGVYTTGSYADPAWIASLAKSKVGLGNVENTALSTWAGSANITTLGALASMTTTGTAKAAMFNANAANGTGDRAVEALSVNDVLRWRMGLSATESGSNAGSDYAIWSYADDGAYIAQPFRIDRSTGNVLLSSGVDDGVNKLQVNGSISAAGTISATGINVPKQLNFAIVDTNAAIPAHTAWVWTPEYGNVTLTQVRCVSDTGDGVIQITKPGPINMLNANLTCTNGTWGTTTSFATATLTQSWALGYTVISGTAKQYTISIRYTGN